MWGRFGAGLGLVLGRLGVSSMESNLGSVWVWLQVGLGIVVLILGRFGKVWGRFWVGLNAVWVGFG